MGRRRAAGKSHRRERSGKTRSQRQGVLFGGESRKRNKRNGFGFPADSERPADWDAGWNCVWKNELVVDWRGCRVLFHCQQTQSVGLPESAGEKVPVPEVTSWGQTLFSVLVIVSTILAARFRSWARLGSRADTASRIAGRRIDLAVA
jgi:hypothetical protein